MSTSLVRCFLHRSLLIWILSVVLLKLPTGQCRRVVNAAVGESAVLSGTNHSSRVTNLLWRKGGLIIQKDCENITIYNQTHEGRLTLSKGDGSLTINPLIKSDSGEYTFESLPPPWSTETHVIQLNVYDRIVSVEMNSQVSYSPDNSTCNVTLSCTVKGSVVELRTSWSKDHKKIPDTEGKETLVVTPTAGEELYSCTVYNPVSSQTASLRVSSCQTHVLRDISIYLLAGTGALFLLVLTIIGRIFHVRAKRKVTREIPVYAEVRERRTRDNGSRQALPSGGVSSCYDVLRSTSANGKQHALQDIGSRQAAPGDVSTCYDFLKSPSDASSGISTIYETVKFVDIDPPAAVTQAH